MSRIAVHVLTLGRRQKLDIGGAFASRHSLRVLSATNVSDVKWLRLTCAVTLDSKRILIGCLVIFVFDFFCDIFGDIFGDIFCDLWFDKKMKFAK